MVKRIVLLLFFSLPVCAQQAVILSNTANQTELAPGTTATPIAGGAASQVATAADLTGGGSTQTAGTGGVVPNECLTLTNTSTYILNAALYTTCDGTSGSTVSSGSTFTFTPITAGVSVTLTVDGAVSKVNCIGLSSTAGFVHDLGFTCVGFNALLAVSNQTLIVGKANSTATTSGQTVAVIPLAPGTVGQKIDTVVGAINPTSTGATTPGTGAFTTITATGTIKSSLGTAAITSATPGTGVTSVTCATAACNVSRGTYTVVGGTGTTGTFATLLWPTTTTAWACSVVMNGGTGFLGLGHSVATATGMTVSAGVTIVGTTFNFDYQCQP